MSTDVAAPPETTFLVYRSDAERTETQGDVIRDSARRRARGEPSRDLRAEPARRRAGPWYSFRPFGDEPAAEPYAVIRSVFPVGKAADPYGEPLARLGTGAGSTLDLSAGEVLDAALASRFQLVVTGGPVVDELAGLAAERKKAHDAEQDAIRAERDAARRADAEARAATLSAPTPTLGALLWVWRREVFGVGYLGATERFTPLPATVFAVRPRPPLSPPPDVSAVVFSEAGAVPACGLTYSPDPRDGCWSWPVEDFTTPPRTPLDPTRRHGR